MAWLYAELEFTQTILALDRILLWISANTHCYFAIDEFGFGDFSYFAGTAGHALDTGELLTAYDTEAEARTNYLTTVKDADGFVLAMFPGYQKARYVRVYIDEDQPTTLWEMFPGSYWYVGDSPVNGYTMVPISSNWAYDHVADTEPTNQTITISSGVAAASGLGKLTLCAEAGVTDQLDKITGLTEGEIVILKADSGDTITVADGAFLNLSRGLNFPLTGNSTLMLICDGGDVCSECGGRSINQ